MSKQVRLSGIAFESLVNGPGLRRVFFAQGCIHDCKGCFNPDTHSLDGGELHNIDKLVEDVKQNPMLKGVTFSGGDPFEQAEEFTYMAKELKKLGINIWCYTGYMFEYILNMKKDNRSWEEILNYIDVLVDGRFEEHKKDSTLKFRGSSNQRIIDIKKSLEQEVVVIIEF